MGCERYADALMGHLYGELTPPEEQAFLAHAKTCHDCRAELAALGGVQALSARAAPLPDPPEAISFRIMEAARQAVPAGGGSLKAPAAAGQTPGLLSWLLKPWTMGLTLAGAAAALALVVGRGNLTGGLESVAQAPTVVTTSSDAPSAKPEPELELPGALEDRVDQTTARRQTTPLAADAEEGEERVNKAPARYGSRGDAPPAEEQVRSELAKDLGGARGPVPTEGNPDMKKAEASAPADKVQQAAQGGAAAADPVAGEAPGAAPAGKMRLREAKAGKKEARLGAPPSPPVGLVLQPKPVAPQPQPLFKGSLDLRRGGDGKTATLEEEYRRPQESGSAGNAMPPPDAEPRADAERAQAPKRKVAMRPVPSSPLALPRPSQAPAVPQTGTDDDGMAGADMDEAPAKQKAGSGAGRRAPAASLTLPHRQREKAREERNEASRALARDRRTLEAADSQMKAQEEMSAGAELLTMRDVRGAYEAFRRAERLDSGHELTPNPQNGQAVALARLGQCQKAVDMARKIGRTHPQYAQRTQALADAAACFERKGQKALAQAARDEADRISNRLAHANTQDRVSRAAEVSQSVRADQAGRLVCERMGVSTGELPGAAGQWQIKVTLGRNGNVTQVATHGPQPAPGVERCLKLLVKHKRFPAGEENQVVDVDVVLRPMRDSAPTLKARATHRPPNAASEAESDAAAESAR